jgi:hypothetical protein
MKITNGCKISKEASGKYVLEITVYPPILISLDE